MKNLWAAAFATACLICDASATQRPKDKLKVFILSGQSNMLGKAAAYTLDAAIKDAKTRNPFKRLKEGDEWVKREDVWVSFLSTATRSTAP